MLQGQKFNTTCRLASRDITEQTCRCASMPYILRKTERDSELVLVGEALIASFASGCRETVAGNKYALND